MILFVNVFVTEVRKMGFRYDRYGLPWHCRFDIFKYALASLSAMNPLWSRVVIYCQLDKCFSHRWWELEGFINSVFENKKIVLRKHRCRTQAQWQEAYKTDLEPVSDSLIWYQGNDDHIFIDYNLDQINDITHAMYMDQAKYVSCMYSHWPEYVRFAAQNKAANFGCAAVFNSFNTDAIHIVNKPTFERWWFKRHWRGRNLVRTDFIKFFASCPTKCYIPYRELVRHFDGYSHCMHLPDCCPPLYIPTGFFKHNIKIAYGARRRQRGWTTINPLLPYRTVSRHGVDFRYMEDEIPLFWRDRISEFKVVNHVPNGHGFRARNNEKLAILANGHKQAGRVLPVLPAGWMKRYLFRRVGPATLL